MSTFSSNEYCKVDYNFGIIAGVINKLPSDAALFTKILNEIGKTNPDKICFNDPNFTTDEVSVFANFLKTNTTIELVNLECSNISNWGLEQIAEALKDNNTVKSIILCGMKNITSAELVLMTYALKTNTSIVGIVHDFPNSEESKLLDKCLSLNVLFNKISNLDVKKTYSAELEKIKDAVNEAKESDSIDDIDKMIQKITGVTKNKNVSSAEDIQEIYNEVCEFFQVREVEFKKEDCLFGINITGLSLNDINDVMKIARNGFSGDSKEDSDLNN